MRAADTIEQAARQGGAPVVEISSWLGDEFLGVLPVVSGSWEATDEAGTTVPGTLGFDVPNTPEWRPLTAGHALGSFGQRYRLRLGFGDELLTIGWWHAARTLASGNVLQASGRGLLRLVERARLTRPYQTATGATRAGVLAELLRGILPLEVDAALADEAIPVTTWEEDRLAAVWELVESWDARLMVDDSATVVALPAWDDTSAGDPVGLLVDGVGGLLSDLQPAGDNTDEDPFNGYVVSTAPEGDETPVVAVWTMPDGPMAWDGPYGYNPGFFSSPLNPADPARLAGIAERMTRREVARQQRWSFVAALDPRFEVGDVVQLRHRRFGVDTTARILSLSFTRTSMTGTVAEVTP